MSWRNCGVDSLCFVRHYIMRTQRIGDALLRTKSSPILAFLAPSVPLSSWSPLRGNVLSPLRSSQTPASLRCLATKTSPLNALSASAAKNDEDEAAPSLSDIQATSRKNLKNLVVDVLSSNSGKTAKPHSSLPYGAKPERSSTTADLFRRSREQNARTKGYLDERQGLIAGNLWGDCTKAEFKDLDSKAAYIRQSATVSAPVHAPPAPIRLDAFIGRSEEVNPLKGVDLGRALRKLEMKCAYNNVRKDFNKQRFHERPGLKRKRLKSQRWRKRFTEGFKAVVAKVQDMRMRGW